MRDHIGNRRRTDDCTGEGSRSAGARDRAQLVLVAGFVLAVTFVALALLLNTAIFAENLATRQTGQQAADAGVASETVTSGLEIVLMMVNSDTSVTANEGDLVENFSDATTNWTVYTNHHYAVDGTSTRIEVIATAPGTRILQDNASRNFTAGGQEAGTRNWVVFDNVDARNVSWFQMNVSKASLNVSTLNDTIDDTTDNTFTVRVTNSTGHQWRVHIFTATATGNAYVLVEEDGEFEGDLGSYVDYVSEACLTREEHVIIDLWDGEVSGEPCRRLSFVGDLSGPVEVRFENTTRDPLLGDEEARIRGRYDILINETDIDDDVYFSPDADSSPYTRTALTWARVDINYSRTDVTHDETESLQPARVGAVSPVAVPNASFDVNDSSGLIIETALEVNWAVSDRNGDLDSVTVTIENAGGTPVYQDTHAVSGENGYGVDPYTDTDDDGPYTITVTVTDHAGHSDSTVQVHDADGDNQGDPP